MKFPRILLEEMDPANKLYLTPGFSNTASDAQIIEAFKKENGGKYGIRHHDCPIVFIPVGDGILAVDMDDQTKCPITLNNGKLHPLYSDFEEFVESFKHIEVLLSKTYGFATAPVFLLWLEDEKDNNLGILVDPVDNAITLSTRDLELNYLISKDEVTK